MNRLTIVVPYRNRLKHLSQFVPMVRAYFARDKADRHIPYRVLVIEQADDLPFNRGALNNAGFLLGQSEGDYTCFHDIDYLPIWADYSWSDVPTAIVWFGAESRPISVSDPRRRVIHDLEKFFGAVTLVPNAIFTQVDGYANDYWGWGYEDTDLRNRFATAGFTCGRRKGTFRPLDHDNRGFNLDGTPTLDAVRNRRLFQDRWSSLAPLSPNGLSTLRFEILDRQPIPEGPVIERPALWERVKVRLRPPATTSPSGRVPGDGGDCGASPQSPAGPGDWSAMVGKLTE